MQRGLRVVARHEGGFDVGVEVAEVGLGERVALLGGLAEPLRGGGVILLHADALVVIRPEPRLRLGAEPGVDEAVRQVAVLGALDLAAPVVKGRAATGGLRRPPAILAGPVGVVRAAAGRAWPPGDLA